MMIIMDVNICVYVCMYVCNCREQTSWVVQGFKEKKKKRQKNIWTENKMEAGGEGIRLAITCVTMQLQ